MISGWLKHFWVIYGCVPHLVELANDSMGSIVPPTTNHQAVVWGDLDSEYLCDLAYFASK